MSPMTFDRQAAAFTDSKMSYWIWRPLPPPPYNNEPCGANTTCSNEPNPTGAYPTDQSRLPEIWIEYVGYVYVMPIICMLGVVLNLLTVIIFNCRQFKSPTYTYLCALATADIVTCLFTLPIGVSRGGSTQVDQASLVYEVYVFMPLTNMSETMSAWMVILLAIERLITIKRTTTDRSYQTARRKARYITLAVASGAVVLNLPYFFAVVIDDEKPTMNHFDDSGVGFSIFSWTRATLVQFLPLVVLVILNCFLLQQLRTTHRRYRKLSCLSRQSSREFAQLRLTLMLIGTVVLFIIGNVPVALAYTVLFEAIFGKKALFSDFYAQWRVVTHLISIMCYGLDFLVYCFANTYFRHACASVVTCHRQRKKISDVSSSNDFNPGFNTPRQGKSPANSQDMPVCSDEKNKF